VPSARWKDTLHTQNIVLILSNHRKHYKHYIKVVPMTFDIILYYSIACIALQVFLMLLKIFPLASFVRTDQNVFSHHITITFIFIFTDHLYLQIKYDAKKLFCDLITISFGNRQWQPHAFT